MHFWALARRDGFTSNGKTSGDNVFKTLRITALHFSPLRRGRVAPAILRSAPPRAVAPLPPPEKAPAGLWHRCHASGVGTAGPSSPKGEPLPEAHPSLTQRSAARCSVDDILRPPASSLGSGWAAAGRLSAADFTSSPNVELSRL